MGCVGGVSGESFSCVFNERGVDVTGLQWDQQRPSRIVLVRRDKQGDRQVRTRREGGHPGRAGGRSARLGLPAELTVPVALGVVAVAVRRLLR